MITATLPTVRKVKWHHVKQCLTRSRARADAQWAGPAIVQEQAVQLCSPSSSRELPGGQLGLQPTGFQAAAQDTWARVGEKSNVFENSQIPWKPNYLHCLFIALLLPPPLPPSKKLGSDLRYRPGKAGPCCFSRGCLVRRASWPPKGAWPAAHSPLPSVSPIITHRSLHYGLGPLYRTCK